MKAVDYSPPSAPTLEQQHDALSKGLGRSFVWGQAGKLNEETLLNACLHDLRFDCQVENSRGEWLWRIVEATDSIDRFRAPILNTLSELTIDRSAVQLCELARRYIEHGDDSFRSVLYDIIEQKPFPELSWLAEDQIVQLDGEKGFLFAVRVRGEQSSAVELEWDDWQLIDDAIERFGEERVQSILCSSEERGVRSFVETWRSSIQRKKERKANRKKRAGHGVGRERMRAMNVSDILSAAHSQDGCFWMRGWGMQADEAELKEILEHLWEADDPGVMSRLLRVFSNRPLPEFDSRLITLCEQTEPELRRAAFNALECNSRPSIRDFANAELKKGAHDRFVVRLLIRNYEQGDEQRLLEAIVLPDDTNELHWLLSDVIEVLENNAKAECFHLAMAAYRLTPCGKCRFDAARLLHRQQMAPDWLIRECRYDSNEDCRGLFDKSIIETDP